MLDIQDIGMWMGREKGYGGAVVRDGERRARS